MAAGNGTTDGGNSGNFASTGGEINGGDGIIRVDPGAISAAEGTDTTANVASGRGPNGRKLNKDGTERKQRASQSGNATGTAAQKANVSVEAISFSIVAIHVILANAFKVPEIAIDPPRADNLARALKELQRFYPVAVTEKGLAWANVFAALGGTYGPMFTAIAARKAAEKRQQPSNIVRPAQFQQRPTVQTPPQPAPPVPGTSPPVQTPDGDIIPGTAPMTGAKLAPSDQQFAATPPELM